ncbi:Nn.00g041120.m01.CDS01 [Neocucurbitaria sp. VM-36]
MAFPPVLTLECFLELLKTQSAPRPYDAATEDPPDHPWFRLPKDDIDKLLKDFSLLVVDCLKEAPRNDKELQHIYQIAKSLAQVNRSPPVAVAFVGPQGAGKSLLLCALFDCNAVSLTGAEGKACTSSAIRYLNYTKSEDGTKKYFGEIQFLDAKKLGAMFDELCRHYYFYHHADEDSDDEDEHFSSSTRKQSNMDELKDTAEDILTALWGSKAQFEERWSPESYKSGEFVRLCRLKFEEALQAQNTNNQRIATKMGTDQNDLLTQLKPFITQVQGQDCLWPLVDNVAVRFYHDMLQQGLEIIDLPGCGDTNAQRARHIEELRGRVNFEVIIADTVRIESDHMFIEQARAAIHQHGTSNVQLVATKIDALDANQLMQYTGEPYDTIKLFMKETDHAEEQASEDDDMEHMIKREQLRKYKAYLVRTLKQHKVAERAEAISRAINTKLEGRRKTEAPPLCHSSAFEYMNWTTKPKINISNQPALSPEETGIPQLRRKLKSLPAAQNLKDYDYHIHIGIQALIDKARRTVKQQDRDDGFRTIADAIELLGKDFLTRLLVQLQTSFRNISGMSIGKLGPDLSAFKSRVGLKVENDWFKLRFFTFNRILKGRGIVAKGVSKAKGLEQGRNLNQELSEILAPGFNRWHNAHTTFMEPMEDALRIAVDQLHTKTMTTIDKSTANIVTIDKAKAKWGPYRDKIQAKMMILMTEVAQTEKRALDWATMQFRQHSNLVGSITDDWYDDILKAAPELKPSVAEGKQKKQYMKPGKFQYQKDRMASYFLSSQEPFADRALKHFQAQFDQDMKELLDKHFADVTKQLEDFASYLRGMAPLDYVMTTEGVALREDLEELIPQLEEKARSLQKLVPHCEQADGAPTSWSDTLVKVEDDGGEFQAIYDKMAKQKKQDQAHGAKHGIKREDASGRKRIKHELS